MLTNKLSLVVGRVGVVLDQMKIRLFQSQVELELGKNNPTQVLFIFLDCGTTFDNLLSYFWLVCCNSLSQFSQNVDRHQMLLLGHIPKLIICFHFCMKCPHTCYLVPRSLLWVVWSSSDVSRPNGFVNSADSAHSVPTYCTIVVVTLQWPG